MHKKEMVKDIVAYLGSHGYKIRGLTRLISEAYPRFNPQLFGIWLNGYAKHHLSILLTALERKGIPLERIPGTQKEEESALAPRVASLGCQRPTAWFVAHGWWECRDPECDKLNGPNDNRCNYCDRHR